MNLQRERAILTSFALYRLSVCSIHWHIKCVHHRWPSPCVLFILCVTPKAYVTSIQKGFRHSVSWAWNGTFVLKKKCQATMFCKYIQKSSCTTPLRTSFWSVEKIHQTYFDPLLQVQVCRCSLISLETRREYDITTLQPPPPPPVMPLYRQKATFLCRNDVRKGGREKGRRVRSHAVCSWFWKREGIHKLFTSEASPQLCSFLAGWASWVYEGGGVGGTLTCASYMEVALSTTEKTHLLNVFPLEPPPHHCKPGIDEENC